MLPAAMNLETDRMSDTDRPLISAHRGGRLEAPENTLDAFARLANLGIRAAECDVHLSADGIPVVIHDETVDRTTNGRGEVHTIRSAELAQLDASVGFADWPSTPGVPSFADVLKVARDLDYFEIEIKSDDSHRIDQLVPLLIEEIDKRSMRNLVRFISFDPDILKLCHVLVPDMAMSLITLQTTRAEIRHARDLGCTGIAGDVRPLSAEFVADAHAAGLRVTCWTVNSDDDFANMCDWGVDVVTTDRPIHMQALLDTRSANR